VEGEKMPSSRRLRAGFRTFLFSLPLFAVDLVTTMSEAILTKSKDAVLDALASATQAMGVSAPTGESSFRRRRREERS